MRVGPVAQIDGRFSPIQSAHLVAEGAVGRIVIHEQRGVVPGGDGMRSGPQGREPLLSTISSRPTTRHWNATALALAPDLGADGLAGEDRRENRASMLFEPLRPVVGAGPQDRVRRHAEACRAVQNGPLEAGDLGARGIGMQRILIAVEPVEQREIWAASADRRSASAQSAALRGHRRVVTLPPKPPCLRANVLLSTVATSVPSSAIRSRVFWMMAALPGPLSMTSLMRGRLRSLPSAAKDDAAPP
jgi:hypothetical protein